MDDRAPDARRISRILIANRGEIAVRIIRTCRALGISTVAIYSTPDSRALHVLEADEAVWIGPAPAVSSYLDIDRVVDAARKSGADAVHPGYGFLAENAEFAEAVVAAGLIWIGPPAGVIRLLGDKVAAKQLAREAGVPIVPGYSGDDQSGEAFAREAERIGFPVMVKASAGGGGKGMRTVSRADDLRAAVDAAQREAQAAFGDRRVFLEKLVERPRHVEFQVFLDERGHGLYLGERECSVQRRHQKVLEEAPSSALTPELRASMGEDAVRLVKMAGYVNAGTVEFLFTGSEYYFLEVNTRIQVEHPVTERITGFDLVEWQIRVAEGAQLPVTNQNDVRLNGHSMEVRLYAEDPDNGFLPSAGRVGRITQPHGGAEGRAARETSGDVRVDIGVYPRFEVTTYYDPMLAKIISWGETRHAALAALERALNQTEVEGLTTNLEFLRWLVRQPEVRDGSADVAFLDRAWPAETPLPEQALLPLAIAALWMASDAASGDPWGSSSGWRMNAAPRCFRLGLGRTYQMVEMRTSGDVYEARVETWTSAGRVLHRDETSITVEAGDKIDRVDVRAYSRALLLEYGERSFRIDIEPPPDPGRTRGGAGESGEPVAPMPATVVRVDVSPGDRVTARQPLVVLEAMKMEHVVQAPREGVIAEVLVAAGDLLAGGAPVVRMEPA